MLKLYFSYLVKPVFTRLNDFLKKGGKLFLRCQGYFQLSRKCIISNNCYFLKSNCVTPNTDLVEQIRTESQEVSVKFEGGEVRWNPGSVVFGDGVFIGGVPVDPKTQMPHLHPSQKVERIIWVDFQFAGINASALNLLKQTLEGIKRIAFDIYHSI